jgi:hypothetical protein
MGAEVAQIDPRSSRAKAEMLFRWSISQRCRRQRMRLLAQHNAFQLENGGSSNKTLAKKTKRV